MIVSNDDDRMDLSRMSRAFMCELIVYICIRILYLIRHTERRGRVELLRYMSSFSISAFRGLISHLLTV